MFMLFFVKVTITLIFMYTWMVQISCLNFSCFLINQMAETLDLMENIRQKFLLERIVPALGQPSSHINSLIGVSQAPPNFPQSSLASRSMMQQHAPFSALNPLRSHTLRSHMSENLSSPTFEPNSLNQQIRRYHHYSVNCKL